MARVVQYSCYMASRKYPNGHKVKAADSDRIRCMCGARAEQCEYSRWALPTKPRSQGISFWYYCGTCWRRPGPMGTTPEQRALDQAAA